MKSIMDPAARNAMNVNKQPRLTIDAVAKQGTAVPNLHRNNGFDLLRLIAAMLVLAGHAFSLTGAFPPGLLGNPIGTVGVKIFFVTSGYLVTQSWLADPRLSAFAMRRALRIMPALIFVVLVTSLMLGPFFSSLSLKSYFHSSSTWFYMCNIAFYPNYSLPGVFGHNPYPIAVNGSLWSLPVEVLMYLLTPIIVGYSIRGAKLALPLFALCCALSGIWFVRVTPVDPVPVVYGTSLISLVDVAPYFQLGAVYAVFQLNRFSRPVLSLGLVASAQIVLSIFGSRLNPAVVTEISLLLTLPFAVVSVGYIHISGPIGRLLAKGDLSYGVYLYAFPMQQAVTSLYGDGIGPVTNFILAGLPTFACAWLSWHFVERNALRLKPPRAVGSRPDGM